MFHRRTEIPLTGKPTLERCTTRKVLFSLNSSFSIFPQVRVKYTRMDQTLAHQVTIVLENTHAPNSTHSEFNMWTDKDPDTIQIRNFTASNCRNHVTLTLCKQDSCRSQAVRRSETKANLAYSGEFSGYTLLNKSKMHMLQNPIFFFIYVTRHI